MSKETRNMTRKKAIRQAIRPRTSSKKSKSSASVKKAVSSKKIHPGKHEANRWPW